MIKRPHILEKNSAIDESIVRLQQKLLNADFNIVEQSQLNPMANIWSVTIVDRDCPLLFSKGHGISEQGALENALCGFTKGLLSHFFWSDYYLGLKLKNNNFLHHPKENWFKTNIDGSWPNGVLNGEIGKELREFYNPVGELNASSLIEMNSSDQERGICCIPYECLSTGEMINFPVNIIDNLYANNGLSSANTREEARLNALSEIIERYVQFKIIATGTSLPDIPDEVISRYPVIQESIQEIKAAGFSLLVQDASLGGKYPVIVATLLNPKNQDVSSSFGSHPQFSVALERSLTGLVKGRNLDQTDGVFEAGFDMDEIASPHNLEKHFKGSSGNILNDNISGGIVAWKFLNDKTDYEFVDWDIQQKSSASEEFKQLCELIHAEGNDIFIADYHDMDVDVCRIIVPGMSEIYPVDDLVLENNNVGMKVRQQILKANKTVAECELLIEDLEDLNQADECLVASLIGMPSDDDCIFKDLCVAELITLLALKIQDNERIQEGCEWLLHFQELDSQRLKTYQCINTILQLDVMTNYATALEKLYTREILNDALALIDGEDVFPLNSEWKMHNLLIIGYRKMLKMQFTRT